MIGQQLSITGLDKTYPGAEHPVFQGYNLDVEAGTLCAVVGVSGVGKTTLLNCIAALDHWDAGSRRRVPCTGGAISGSPSSSPTCFRNSRCWRTC
jgi:ABC-type nitrate/sulfonate/bicarbonate transport system ATPase subunit